MKIPSTNLIVIFLLLVHPPLLESWLFPLSNVVAPLIINSILPTREQLRPPVDVPSAVRKFYPLPQEELLNSYSRGNSYLVSGDFDLALIEFNRALDVAPNSADVYMSRGIVKEKLLDWQSAIDDYKKANDIYKKRPFGRDDATAFSNMANAETGLLQWDQALQDFNYAAKLDSNFEAPKIGRSLVLYQLGKFNEAEQGFRAIIDKYPDFPDGQAAYAIITFKGINGDCSSMKERLAAAKEHWDAAIQVDSRYKDVAWVAEIRRWPPAMVADLRDYLAASNRQ